MLVTSIFSFSQFPQCFQPVPKQSSIFQLHLFSRLPILPMWTSLKICCLVKRLSPLLEHGMEHVSSMIMPEVAQFCLRLSRICLASVVLSRVCVCLASVSRRSSCLASRVRLASVCSHLSRVGRLVSRLHLSRVCLASVVLSRVCLASVCLASVCLSL